MARFWGFGSKSSNVQKWTADIINRTKKFNHRSAILLAVLISAPLLTINAVNANQNDQDNADNAMGSDDTSTSANQEINVVQENKVSASSEASTSYETSAKITGTGHPSDNKVEVSVNGQTVTVPKNGSVHTVVEHEGGNGQTVVDIQNQQTGTGNSSSFSHSFSSSVTNTNSSGGSTTVIQQR